VKSKSKWVLVILVSLAVLPVSLAILVRWRDQAALARYKQRLVDAGEVFSVAALSLPVPAASAAAARVFSEIPQGNGNVPWTMAGVAPGKARVGLRSETLLLNSSSQGRWEDLDAMLGERREPIQRALEFVRRGEFPQWAIRYSDGFQALCPHLAQAKSTSLTFTSGLITALHHGDPEAAADFAAAQVAIITGLSADQLLISQLVAQAVAAIAFQPAWEGLQTRAWNEAQLARLQRGWEGPDFLQSLTRSLIMERAMTVSYLQTLRASPGEFAQFVDSLSAGGTPTPPLAAPTSTGIAGLAETALHLGRHAVTRAGARVRALAWCWLWSFEDERRVLSEYQTLIQESRSTRNGGPLQDLAPEIPPDDEIVSTLESRRYPVSSSAVAAVRRSVSRTHRAIVLQRMMVTAIALHRYQLVRSGLPRNLDELTPAFLAVVQLDPMDGKPLRYRPNADGSFLLYSIGENRVEEGGDPNPRNPNAGNTHFLNGRDIVWPLPATQQESDHFERVQASKRAGKR
jgi:hypothetical protein